MVNGDVDPGSYADLIRVANLPKAVTSAFADEPLYFWSPALLHWRNPDWSTIHSFSITMNGSTHPSGSP